MNEYFSGTRPDLISMKSINDLAPFIQHSEIEMNILNNINGGMPSTSSFSIKQFYQSYIKPNILPIIIIVIFVGCIIIRYLSINDKKNALPNQSDPNPNTDSKSLIENFNPAKPVFSQVNHNVYVEPPVEELKKTQLVYDMDDELFNKILSRMDEPSVNLDNVPHIDPSVSDPLEYREQIQSNQSDHNEWANQHDGIPNPFYGNNYISSTADAVDFTRDLNRQNINMGARKIFG